jgi:thymidylate synthase ThyX
MSYEAKVLADSISPDGVRLTTLQVTFPRIVLAEMNTHRMLSRNSASSRAIPVEKRIKMIEEDPFIPEQFGKNQKGMQAEELLEEDADMAARNEWKAACKQAIQSARNLSGINVHKQLANRLLEPFAWHTVICSATEWENFFNLRCNPDAQPEIRKAAELMRDAMVAGTPTPLSYGEWHLPLVEKFEFLENAVPDNPLQEPLGRAGLLGQLCKISIARCARVSYLTHEGKRDPQADLDLYERLATSGHMSPLEHVARPMTDEDISSNRFKITGCQQGNPGPYACFIGNFRGWVSYRKLVPGEEDIVGHKRKHASSRHEANIAGQ